MKLTIDPRSLAEAAAWAARAIPLRPAVPILSGILLEASEGKLTVSVFDYDTSVAWELDCDVAEPGRVVLPGRVLAEVAKALPGESFAELALSGHEVTVTCGRATFSLLTLPESDYPSLPEAPPPCGRIDADVLRQAVEQVTPAASRDDAIPALACVRLDVEGDVFTLAATDRYRIAVRDAAWELHGQAPSGVLVFGQRLLDLVKGGLHGPVEIGWDGRQIGFVCAGRTVTARLIDEQYIDYRARVDVALPISATVDTAGLVAAVKRVAVVAEKNTAVRLAFSPVDVTVQAGGGDIGRGAETVPCELAGSDAFQIAFQPQFLLDALSGVAGSQSLLDMETEHKPAVIRGVDDDSYRCLLMSLRVV